MGYQNYLVGANIYWTNEPFCHVLSRPFCSSRFSDSQTARYVSKGRYLWKTILSIM